MKNSKKITALAITLIVSLCITPNLAFAVTVRINQKSAPSVTIQSGETVTLKTKNSKKKTKWTIKSGKKYIRLSSKKKSKVRVKGIQPGTAKLQCIVGKKKLFCRVKVLAATKKKIVVTPKNTTTPTTEPVISAPPATPTTPSTMVPTITPCPTHIPTEDRLIQEPCKCYELPIQDENELPIWRPFGNVYYYFFGSEIERLEIGELIFTDTNKVPSEATWFMDVSERQNGSVMAWYMDSDGDGEAEMTIGQQGGVVANPNSSYLFCDLIKVKGWEHFYTTDVTDMSYMFKRFALTQGENGVKTLDLGCRFETANVTNMENMFENCGFFQLKKLYLGRFFDVSKVTNATGMFMGAGTVSQMTCYVPNEATKRWILDEKNETLLHESEHNVEVMPVS